MFQFVPAKHFLVSFLIIIASCSVKNGRENKVLANSISEDLVNMNKVLQRSSALALRNLEEKQFEALTAERSKKWFAKADSIKRLEDSIVNYIQSTGGSLQNLSDLGKHNFARLFKKLIEYRTNVLRVDSVIYLEFGQYSLFPSDFDKKTNQESEFQSSFFDENTLDETKLALLHFENKVRLFANKVILLCNAQVGYLDGEAFYDSFSAIVGQSSNVIQVGDSLEISAGVGEFSLRAQPKITIGGKLIKVNSYGMAVTTIPGSVIRGKHYVNVMIEFKDQNGKEQKIEKKLGYTVVKRANTP